MANTGAMIFRLRDELERPWRYFDWWGEEDRQVYDQMTFAYYPEKDAFFDECGFEIVDMSLYLDPWEIIVFKTLKTNRTFLRKNHHPTPYEPEFNEIYLIYYEGSQP